VFQKRLDQISEQTAYLLEKQREFLEASESSFDSLLAAVDDKLKTKDREESGDLEDLKSIYDILVAQKQKTSTDVQDDIKFLEEQLAAINQIRSLQDPQKAKELLNMIIDEKEELLETEEFKKQVDQDILKSQKELEVMVDDLKHSLEEENPHELKMLLEAIAAEDEEDDSSCATSCSGCSSQASCGGGMDIFSAFGKDLEKDDEED